VAKTQLLPRIAFFAACLFFAFLFGFIASHFELFPHGTIAPALDEAVRLVENPSKLMDGVPKRHQSEARHDFAGVLAYDEQGKLIPNEQIDAGDGCILITSFWPEYDWRPGLRLIDRRGETLHHWDVDLAKIWPESPYTDGAEAFYGTESYIHGSYVFDNGDVLFNVEYVGLVRLDKHSNVVWKLDRHTHHSVTRAEDGNFWVCEMNWITDLQHALLNFYGLEVPFVEDMVLKVSPEGEVLQQVSILDMVCRSDLRSMLFRAGAEVPTRTFDPLHLNDVEELSSAMAAQYPMFAAGDLVVSLFQFNLVMVFDPNTREVKWTQVTPFVHQHDPDFLGDGWISVFNNNSDGSPLGIISGGSQMLAFRPHTGEQYGIYPEKLDASLLAATKKAPSGHERRFYTRVGGKAQKLPTGNWLIVEAVGGRLFEVDERRHTVWEWCQQRSDDGVMVAEVLEGTWYPFSREQVAGWSR